MTQIDATVNKNWGSGDIIPNVAKDYVSIVWKGYLMPQYDEDYTFYVESNDGVRIYVNDQVVIDKLEDSTSDLDTHLEISADPLPLKAGKLVPITVQFYETTGVAMIALKWESASQPRQIIPASALYYKQSELPITGDSYMIDAIDVPTAPTDLAQDVPATYAHTSLTLTWNAPKDTGCLSVTGYKYQYYDKVGSAWVDAPHSTMNGALTGGTIS